MTRKGELEKMLGVDGVPRALIASSPLSTVVYNMAGQLVFANSAFEDLWGATASQAPAGYSVLHDPQLNAQGVQPLIERAFNGEVVVTPPVRYDAGYIRDGARTVWTTGHFYPLCGSDGTQH